MGLYSLDDLLLAGIKWELNETANKSTGRKVESGECKLSKNLNDQSSTDTFHSPLSTFHSEIIPPSAPVAKPSTDGITDLDSLTVAISEFNHPLKQFANNTVMPNYGKKAGLLIITDVPSSDDDNSGNILTGPAGELMDKMLNAIELNRTDVSIIPLVFWRTPGGRTPAREELDLARPFITRAIELLNPAAILTLGTLTATEIAGAKLPKDHGKLSEWRVESGEWRLSGTEQSPVKFDDCNDTDNLHSPLSTLHSIPTMPIYHPNFLLLKPDSKREVWDALQNLRNLLKTADK